MNRSEQKKRSPADLLSHAQGAMLGQLVGDALGSIVEFMTADEIRRLFPRGVTEMVASPVFHTLPGQPTDDSEMALALARTIVARGEYNAEATWTAYVRWHDSQPFDCGNTISAAVGGIKNKTSQANGAMMRVSPIGIIGARASVDNARWWARLDAELTHPHPVCVEANSIYAAGIAAAIANEMSPQDLYEFMAESATEPSLVDAIARAKNEAPRDYITQQGWVLIALQNALWQLLHAESVETAITNTVQRGGDTDTNAAICGALLGALHGLGAIPGRWVRPVLFCRPQAGAPGVRHPRPEEYWPTDALDLAAKLIGA
ncbi:MAG TPA: ADP-ribosylglycohydrolase family protein [Candidatus Krumholzibacteria bacterium]|nr:ADP-ribosylglycohydrolase family protein [Candidatus Krumholzibacteria bacterium]